MMTLQLGLVKIEVAVLVNFGEAKTPMTYEFDLLILVT